MLDILTFVSNQQKFKELTNLKLNHGHVRNYQVRKGEVTSIAIKMSNDYELLDSCYGLSVKKPVYQIDIRKTLKQRPFNLYVRSARCAIPVNCFFGLKDGHPYAMKLMEDRLFYLGGVYKQEVVMGETRTQFCALTTAPPPALKPFLNSIPVVSKLIAPGNGWT